MFDTHIWVSIRKEVLKPQSSLELSDEWRQWSWRGWWRGWSWFLGRGRRPVNRKTIKKIIVDTFPSKKEPPDTTNAPLQSIYGMRSQYIEELSLSVQIYTLVWMTSCILHYNKSFNVRCILEDFQWRFGISQRIFIFSLNYSFQLKCKFGDSIQIFQILVVHNVGCITVNNNDTR